MTINELMEKMPISWRHRWCEPTESGCACLGCANNAGGLLRHGYTKKDWEDWCKEHPNEEMKAKGE